MDFLQIRMKSKMQLVYTNLSLSHFDTNLLINGISIIFFFLQILRNNVCIP